MTNYDVFSETFSRSRENMYWPEIDALLDVVVEKFTDRSSLKIADIGCGSGRLLKIISNRYELQKVSLNYTGLDISSSLLQIASERTYAKNIRTEFIQATMQKIAIYLKKKYDVVFFIASYHHLMEEQSRASVLEQLKSVLVPGGIVCMTNWYLHSPENEKKY